MLRAFSLRGNSQWENNEVAVASPHQRSAIGVVWCEMYGVYGGRRRARDASCYTSQGVTSRSILYDHVIICTLKKISALGSA